MIEIVITCVLCFVAGVLFQAWRTARCTGQPMLTILRGGGNGEER